MTTIKTHFVAFAFALTSLLHTQQAAAELIAATGETRTATLNPLHNGMSALTLVWDIDEPTLERVSALRASLASIATGGTSSRSSFQIGTFLDLKGVRQHVDSDKRHLLLTVSAPNEVFPETLVHLENILLEPAYSSGWYARQLQYVSPIDSIITRRPDHVLGEISVYLEHPHGEAKNGEDVRFGRPSQAILRSENPEVERRMTRLIQKLPKAEWKLPFSKWAKLLSGEGEQEFALPKGTIHFPDPDSSEMLILLVKAQEFTDETSQVGANVLLDYVGANQGSEMFRVIRQEMRAAYDPRTDFIVMGKNRAIMSLSATVEAPNWPTVYSTMQQIYGETRSGSIDQEGLQIQFGRLDRTYYSDFYSDPVWAAWQYLHEHPKGVDGSISLPLFQAFGTISLTEVAADSDKLLPPLDDYLLILIGGGTAPATPLKSSGYCALPKSARLSYCLDRLSNVQMSEKHKSAKIGTPKNESRSTIWFLKEKFPNIRVKP